MKKRKKKAPRPFSSSSLFVAIRRYRGTFLRAFRGFRPLRAQDGKVAPLFMQLILTPCSSWSLADVSFARGAPLNSILPTILFI